jgi:hypothetical protein
VPPPTAVRLSGVMLGVIACVLAALASLTRPFTLGADLVTAIGILLFIALQVVLLLRGRRKRATSDLPLEEDGPSGKSGVGFRAFLPWIVVSASVVALELFEYFSEPRHDHPTLSSLSDDLTRWHAGHAVLFLAWLGLGWLLLKRPGVRRRVAGSR